ncbi:hypothetical protein GCM10011579_032830 [Streptomyces albiflavescens]|uniref:Uncharacterized protein n=1 Tax=Streptomyces albiflavescens TaxID=1623582 RepID=A0A917Y2B6_9ACTN|nr:hypothetical protein [Streptomyces albiflavescens]GGN63952.1 hypothetical protein GCM10011579_032830 [Streptomyces albiflavescens]
MGKTAEKTRQETHPGDGAGLHLHLRTLHPPVPVPYLTREEMTSTARAATTRLPGTPAAKDLVFYGGLGAMAVAGALEWPVALAVGGATWLVRSGRKEEKAPDAQT